MGQRNIGTSAKNQLKSTYEDEDLVITDWNREFNFQYNPSTGLLEVKEDFEMDFVCLDEDPVATGYPIYTDDYSEILSVKVDGRKRKVTSFPFEMDGIFHHDAKVAPVDVYVPSDRTTGTRLYFQKSYSDSKYLTRKFLGTRYPVLHFNLKLKFKKNADVEVLIFHGEKYGVRQKTYDSGTERIIEIIGDSLPSFQNEDFSRGAAFYEPHIIILSKGVTLNGERKNLLSSADDLYGWYASLVKEIGNKTEDLESFTAEIVKGCSDKDCEMEQIFYWVQDNIRYIAFEDGIAGFKPEACQDVFYNKYGDCKGMANLMCEMLKTRGLDARLTWIGTRSLPYDYSIPSLSVDNHMICTVVGEDGTLRFLDGTEKYIAFDDVAERIQGRPVMIEDGETYILSEVPSFTHHRNEELLEVSYQVEGEKLKGRFDYTVKGEGKVRMMNRYANVPTKDRSEAKRIFFTKGNADITIGEGTYTELEDRLEEIEWSADFEARNRVNVFGDELFLDWDIHRSYSGSRFKEDELEDIKGDLNFKSKVYDIERYTISPIDGFHVKEVPADFKVKKENFDLAVEFTPLDDGSIQIEKTIIIPNASIPNEELHEWNETISRLDKDVYSSPIIYEKD